MDKPSKAEFLEAARAMRAFCEQQQYDSCRDCPAGGGGGICLITTYPTAWKFCESQEDAPKNEVIYHPSHYTQGGVECIDAIEAATGDGFAGYCAGNVIKYVYRYRNKGGVEDLKKARWYLNKLIECEGGGGDG